MVENEESNRPLDNELKSELFRHGLEVLLKTRGIHHPPPPIVTKLFTSPWKMDIKDVDFVLETLGDVIPKEISDNAIFYAKKHTKEQFIEAANDLFTKTEQKADENIVDKPVTKQMEIDNSYSPLRMTTKEINCELFLRDMSKLLVDRKVPVSSVIINYYSRTRNISREDKIMILSSLGWQKTTIDGIGVDMYAKSTMISDSEDETTQKPINYDELPYKEPTYIKVDRLPHAHKHLRLPTENEDIDDDYYPDNDYWLKQLAEEEASLCEKETPFLYPQPEARNITLRKNMYRPRGKWHKFPSKTKSKI